MSNWIYGKDLIEHWDIEDFELFGFLKKGLQPYDKLGRKVIDSDCLEWDRKWTLEHCENLVRGTQETGVVISKSLTPDCRLTEQEIKRQGKELYESLPLEILNPPKDLPYMSVSLPSNDKEAAKAIASVMYLKFKEDDALVFAEMAHPKFSDYYQHVNLTALKDMAQGWANRFSVIKQITLYRADRDWKYVLDVRIDDSDQIEYRYFEEHWIDKACYLDGLRDR
jgi:hypothetical protein